MADLIQRSGERWVVRTNDDLGRAGRMILWSALAITFLLLLVGAIGDMNDIWLFMLLPGGLLLVGVPFALMSKKTVFDLGQRRISIGRRELPFDNVAAIVATTRVENWHTQHGDTPLRRYELGLNLMAAGSPVPELLDELSRETREWVVETTGYRGRAQAVQRIEDAARKLARIRSHVDSSTAWVCQHSDEARVWVGAEMLAKRLRVPLLDYCGERAELRTPADLDLFLQERLQRGLVVAEEFEADVEGVSSELTRDRLAVRWRGSKRGSEPKEILVTEERIEVDFDSMARGRQEVFLDALEQLRVNREIEPSLNLMTDGRVLRVPMSVAQANWVRARIERHLTERANAG